MENGKNLTKGDSAKKANLVNAVFELLSFGLDISFWD